MKCLNCETDFEGNYCPQCNQKSSTKRLTIISVIRDFMAALSDSDKGFLKTVIDLSKNPGLTINNYISGKRSRYLSAGKYTFFLTVLFTINITYIEHHFAMFESLMKGLDKATVMMNEDHNLKITNKGVYNDPGFKEIKEGEAVSIDFDFMGKHYEKKTSKVELINFLKKMLPHYHRTLFDVLKFLVILWIPIFSLFSFFFFFKAPYNFAEHITFNSYTFSHILLIFIGISPAYWIFPQLNSVTFFSAATSALFYLFFSYMQFFTTRRYSLLKTTAALSMSFFTYCLAIIGLMIALAIYIAMTNIHLL